MELASELNREVRGAWHRFIHRTADVRADLYRYCRSLTGSAWDAEDLVQDTLLRSFAKLGEVHHPIANTRAYLFRIASNLWIDRMRRVEPHVPAPPVTVDDAGRGAEVRDAARELMHRLPPRERAAVVLKDVFDFTLEEIAGMLAVSVGAVKSALHRGRGKLEEAGANGGAGSVRPPSCAGEALLDRFADAFNARDIDRLTALLRADASAEVLGMVEEHGAEAIRNGSLHHTMFDEEGEPMAERRVYAGEPVIVLWYTVEHEGAASQQGTPMNGASAHETPTRVVRDVLRFEELDGAIARFRYYYFCPETLAEVIGALGLPLADNGYCYMPAASGA